MTVLGGFLAQAWELLEEGAADPASPWRIMVLANVDVLGGPAVRSVVLRDMRQEARVALVHSDLRSPKIAALAANPRAALLGWDAARRVQIRLDGAIELAEPAETDAAWAALPEGSRATYAGRLAPGSLVDDPAAGTGAPDRTVFCLLRLNVLALEVLSLAHGSHRRARYQWPGGLLAATWLAT